MRGARSTTRTGPSVCAARLAHIGYDIVRVVERLIRVVEHPPLFPDAVGRLTGAIHRVVGLNDLPALGDRVRIGDPHELAVVLARETLGDLPPGFVRGNLPGWNGVPDVEWTRGGSFGNLGREVLGIGGCPVDGTPSQSEDNECSGGHSGGAHLRPHR